MDSYLDTLITELGITSDYIAARSLTQYPVASNLELAELGLNGKEHLLTPSAAMAWRNLKAAALQDNISLFIVSAFRSIERQAEIVRLKLAAGQTLAEILAVSAPPGFSEHHTGRAVDISSPDSLALQVEFEQTAAFAWLNRRASEFGYFLSYPQDNLCGYQYEPWHWCYADTRLAL